MARLTRAQRQARTRARVLAAAGEEFAEHGFREAKVDRIAERVGLTRGAVYSNFPGKRALYFSVLAEAAEHAAQASRPEPGHTAHAALGALARAWVSRLPSESSDDACPGAGLTPEILADEPTRQAFTQLVRLNAVLLAQSLEALEPPPEPGGRRVRVAQTVLTLLYGVSQAVGVAPGLVDPFAVIRSCERLADLDLDDAWPLPHLAHVPPAEPADEPWSPPDALDAVRRRSVSLGEDGVVAVVGTHRLEAVEEALRSAPEGAAVTAVVVSGDPAVRIPLARTAVADLSGCLRRAFPERAWPRLRLVFDGSGEIAAAAGVPEADDATEAAVRVFGGRITARSRDRGAAHAAASCDRTAAGGHR
ncbi:MULTISPECIES: TetR/AcrR family transcriptional regulator [unclassified Nocardiopsis]|uniref:TetR/AcrR family transcriptional regulator n=1 Tax=unclassified Nocardiopsis TaxID=2649073 RepID=UPI001356B610|nr:MULTISPECIES: TetR/AcrR family transcriptional regulator [unclassified Nocardiopsis]